MLLVGMLSICVAMGTRSVCTLHGLLLTRLLHPRETPALQAMRSRHDPVTVGELRDSRTSECRCCVVFLPLSPL